MTDACIPYYWLQRNSEWLEWQLKRLVTDLLNEAIPENYIGITRARIEWLKDRIPYQKTLELITPQS